MRVKLKGRFVTEHIGTVHGTEGNMSLVVWDYSNSEYNVSDWVPTKSLVII